MRRFPSLSVKQPPLPIRLRPLRRPRPGPLCVVRPRSKMHTAPILSLMRPTSVSCRETRIAQERKGCTPRRVSNRGRRCRSSLRRCFLHAWTILDRRASFCTGRCVIAHVAYAPASYVYCYISRALRRTQKCGKGLPFDLSRAQTWFIEDTSCSWYMYDRTRAAI